MSPLAWLPISLAAFSAPSTSPCSRMLYLASARAALSETQTRLSQATIRAPVAGLVISRSVTKGQIIAAGTELFRMVRDGRLELDAQVPETELPLVRAGQSVVVTSSEAGQTTGTVRIVLLFGLAVAGLLVYGCYLNNSRGTLLALVALTVMSPAVLRIWADAVLSVPLPVLP